MFSTQSETGCIILVTFNLSSVNTFNLKAKTLSFGKELTKKFQYISYFSGNAFRFNKSKIC